jgi:flagella basal body P-ring formation protein FlgA
MVDGARMEKIFKDHVLSHCSWPEDKVAFERINAPEDLALPLGDLSWEVRERSRRGYLGNVSLMIDFYVDARRIRTIPVSGTVSVAQAMVRASKTITAGERIRSEDLSLSQERGVRFRKDALVQTEDAVGKRARRAIRVGQILTHRMIEDPPLVNRGQIVQITAENALIRVTTRGKALEDGRAGEQIRVINVSSGREIFGTVRGSGLIEVPL